jgi:membrane dipeptidase
MPESERGAPNAGHLHRDTYVIDAHSDILMDVRVRRRSGELVGAEDRTIVRHHLPGLQAGGVDALVVALFVEPHFREAMLRETLLMVDDLHEEIAESAGALRLVRTRDDLEHAGTGLDMLLSLEGTEALAADLGILRLLHALGLRAVGLTWFGRTMAADGSGESDSGGGLTGFGREVVRECNRLGMLVDLSHLSERGFWDVMAVAQGPVIASHSNARAVAEHHRNLTDDQLRAVAQTGGCVGLNAYRPFVDPERQTIDRLIDHADHMAGVMGPEHIGLGLDLIDYQPGFAGSAVEGLRDHSGLPSFSQRLLERGAGEAEVRAILGGNWLRVWKQVLPSRS